MLNLPALHTYLTQLLSPTDTIHTALLLTPEGAVVSFACSSTTSWSGSGDSSSSQGNATRPLASSSTNGYTTPPQSLSTNGHTTPPQIRTSPKPNTQGSTTPPHTIPRTTSSNCSVSSQTLPNSQYSKDNVWILAGLSSELWAETRGEGDESVSEMGMVESELGRIVVVPVDDASAERDPLLLLAVNGGPDADWEVMGAKAKKLGAYLAPSVNKHRSAIEASPLNRTPANGSKSRTRSTTTSPGWVSR